MRRTVTALLTLLYGIAVLTATIFPITPHPSSYWATPWWTMVHYVPFVVDAASFVLNVVMFVPFGVLMPMLCPRLDSVRRLVGWAAAGSCAIELTQLVVGLAVGSRRTVDVNDLIANAAGALAGLLVLRAAVPDPRHRAAERSSGSAKTRTR